MPLLKSLRAVKLVHTAVWMFFVGCIAAIPLYTTAGRYGRAAVFVAIVALECGILLLNHMRCPLTDVAARFTDDRQANFDIYLPEWLARNNKTLFGSLYLISIVYLIVAWLWAP